MSTTNASTVRQGYEAFGSGDMDTLRRLFASDIVYSIPGDNEISGDYKGPDEVLGLFQNLGQITEGTLRVELKHVGDGETGVLAMHHVTAQRPDGRSLALDSILAFEFRGDEISRVRLFTNDQQAEDPFWS